MIDREHRRHEVVEAVYRVICREGLSGATVRTVADEADLSAGSLRYFFRTQRELLTFAMQTVVDRAGARITEQLADRLALAARGEAVPAVAMLLEQVLPLDGERMREGLIYQQFAAATISEDWLSTIKEHADQQVRLLCEHAVDSLAELHALHARRDHRVETLRLWALLDGLTLHMLAGREATTAPEATTVLRAHLAELAAPPPPAVT